MRSGRGQGAIGCGALRSHARTAADHASCPWQQRATRAGRRAGRAGQRDSPAASPLYMLSSCRVYLTMLLLRPPHRPRSDVTATVTTLAGSMAAGHLRVAGWGEVGARGAGELGRVGGWGAEAAACAQNCHVKARACAAQAPPPCLSQGTPCRQYVADAHALHGAALPAAHQGSRP